MSIRNMPCGRHFVVQRRWGAVYEQRGYVKQGRERKEGETLDALRVRVA